jgi:hypothetical protein
MAMNPFNGRLSWVHLACALAAASAPVIGKDIQFGGAGWMQYGMIAKSGDTADGLNLQGRSLLNSGAQFSLHSQVTENLSLSAGIGAVAGHYLAGSSRNGGYAPMNVSPYVAEANFTYSFWDRDDSKLSLRGGWFPYDYMPDAQNLGLYLLRGPVYPGFVLSGFETKYVLPVANTLGLQVHHQAGSFQHDLLLTVETEFFPYYDLSPAYVASYQAGKVLRIGAGANFYHLIAIDDHLTSADTSVAFVDTADGERDTVTLPFRGIKLMANASFDPKALFSGSGLFGPEDLKLYGEVALIGTHNSKAYRDIYGDMLHRMPMMIGFNLPAFKLLDRLGLEVEWYGAPFKDDLQNYNHIAGKKESPYPFITGIPNETRDNWKWSLYGSRVFESHIKLSVQVASDHFRPGLFNGYGDNAPAGSEVVLTGPKDWYWMTKLAYFF